VQDNQSPHPSHENRESQQIIGVGPLSNNNTFSTLHNNPVNISTEKGTQPREVSHDLQCAQIFVDKAVASSGYHSTKIPTHRELLQVGVPTAVQVTARRFLVSTKAIIVNVRSVIADPFETLGDLKEYIDSLSSNK